MAEKRVLLMYISKNSGHHCASLAIESALRALMPDAKTLNVNSLNYTNPILGNIINKTYISVIKRKPEVWGYLYDNPDVVRRTRKLRETIHRYNSGRLKNLIENFGPDAVVCTQAFPCGMVADYKKTSRSALKLYGVLTDYAPHSYWVYDLIDGYFVPSDDTGQRLVDNGVPKERVRNTGIPVNPKFDRFLNRDAVCEKLGLSKGMPVVLVMGGSQGLGPIKDMVQALNKISAPVQIVTVCGDNKKVFAALKRREAHFEKKTIVLPYADNMDEIMEASDIIVTKPGGITIAESLAKGLCILIVRPIPGQEAMNTDFLLKNEMAIKADSPADVPILVEELLHSPAKLRQMRERAKKEGRPDSATQIAKEVLESIS